MKIEKVLYKNKEYPQRFRMLKKPPSKIWFAGELKLASAKKSIAIVGSRRMTSYGGRVVEKLTAEFVSAGYVIVSGFMYGVDTKAHEVCLDCGGQTVAVIGSGLEKPYPEDNKDLMDAIIKRNGLVISQYAPDKTPRPWMFAKRNKLIAALCVSGVIVVEAGEKSGALLTAKYALELNRELYAVPGPIVSLVSKGTNKLILDGAAKPLLEASQITKKVFQKENKFALPAFENKLQKKLYKLLQNEDMGIDKMSLVTGYPTHKISIELSQMQIQDIVMEDRGVFRVNQTRR